MTLIPEDLDLNEIDKESTEGMLLLMAIGMIQTGKVKINGETVDATHKEPQYLLTELVKLSNKVQRVFHGKSIPKRPDPDIEG